MKRIFTFDLLRGIAIISVLIIHRIGWDFFYQIPDSVDSMSGIYFIFIFFATMAGIFYCISGAVNVYVSFNRLEEGKSTAKQILYKNLASGFLLIILSYFFRFFLLRETDNVASINPETGLVIGNNSTGLIPYLILYGQFPDKYNIFVLLSVGTLQMIAYSIIVVSIVHTIYVKRYGVSNPQGLRRVFLILGIIIFLAIGIVRPIIGPIALDASESGNLLIAMLLNPFVAGMFPIFPYLSFGFFGAYFGVEFARDDSEPTKVLNSLLRFSLVILITGLFVYITTLTQGIEGWTKILGNKATQLGFFFFLFWLGMRFFDYQPEEIREKRMKWAKPIATMGRISLTIYMLEGIIAVSLQMLIAPVWNSWNATLLNTILFGLINLFVWIVIVFIWKKFNFIGSVEYTSTWLIRRFTGHSSHKATIQSDAYKGKVSVGFDSKNK